MLYQKNILLRASKRKCSTELSEEKIIIHAAVQQSGKVGAEPYEKQNLSKDRVEKRRGKNVNMINAKKEEEKTL